MTQTAEPAVEGRMRETWPGVPVRIEKDDHRPSSPTLVSVSVVAVILSIVQRDRVPTIIHLVPMRSVWAREPLQSGNRPGFDPGPSSPASRKCLREPEDSSPKNRAAWFWL